ncbi:MAG TPA: D-alanyl-D-alanine endopeptidase, partial [Atlantibacter hermannii]|nr:D-alanyl-D-alanine endopeptidase [Atlantibacter hermannii]
MPTKIRHSLLSLALILAMPFSPVAIAAKAPAAH